MTRGKWVLLRGMLATLGMLNFAFGVDSASLSVLTSANEMDEFRVCADLCDAGPSGRPCKVFCTSRRQFTNQSNTVADERDIVVSVGVTRRDACPTLCRHGLGIIPLCTCDADQDSNPKVQLGIVQLFLKNICQSFCKDQYPVVVCPECPEPGDQSSKNHERNYHSDVAIRSKRIPMSLGDANVALVPRGASMKNYVTGELDGIDAEVDFKEANNERRQRTMEKGGEDGDGGLDLDLEEFCRVECARGNGGLACMCDIIP